MSTQLQTQAKACGKSSDTATASNVVKRHFSSQRGFSAEAQHYPIQTKLKIGQPGDKYEQEADRVAEQVMRMPVDNAATQSAPPQIQRLCTECEEELQRQVEEEEEEELLQPKARQGGTSKATPEVSEQVHSLRSGGHPLPESARAFFEPRFGLDFSQVRIHADQRTASSAQALNARAYTRGHDVAFAASQYAPESQSGRQLLAHELTHIVQQSGGSGGVPHVQRTIGDGHDLTATRFSGNAVLEAVYDNERLIRRGHSGTAVRLIQESLLAQGYPLPVFGADRIFGNETDAAVRQFQIDAGAVLLDGIVGPETMKLLDMHDTGGTATTGPVPLPTATGAVFSEHPQETFAGYDNTTVPNNSLVVPTNGRRQVQVAIAPAPAVPAYVSVNPAVASTAPTPDGVAITGVSDGTTRIDVREGITVLDTLNVNVKDRFERTVGFHFMRDTAAPPQPQHVTALTPATVNPMTSFLNRVWERQANVRFRSGTVDTPQLAGNHPDIRTTTGGGIDWPTVVAHRTGEDYNVFAVWSLVVTDLGGIHPNGGTDGAGNTLVEDAGPCGDGRTLPHEAGHFLGVIPHTGTGIMQSCASGRVDHRVTLAQANIVNL
ncbi:MAG: DUF4157 domain-containing protein [Candidatus Scalindua rubra]|uniref:Peptidoglycan binding domain protein n=1 Tax=Candidatus Scalindua brodae TaxID=237368 RepID=A0A0B0EK51_9BACT|nr:MAG: hypothetical protein SCABRO_00848 [Candidatus Scalindua brodae]MBZ0108132.1 DUF4157 domain-containing protein [Candidatus Scalindua rubra]TWU31250.1 putative peptidoglycan binding domain protein [Candidatus Brocadiaceae bacterium S225]